MIGIAGWDIGGANVKVAYLQPKHGGAGRVRTASQPFEIWREKDHLPEVLRAVLAAVTADIPQAMAVTMTAELSDIFATKREGVLFILDSMKACFPESDSYALSLSGEFVSLNESRMRPLDFAAANWLATALWIAKQIPSCLLVDVGSTTTDILPILDGHVCTGGCTDLARLSSGELVFSGVLRTNLATIVRSVPIAGRICRVASEYFAVSGDVHLILGHLRVQDYTCTTPDGQPPSVVSARKRLARLVCADTEMLSTLEIEEMARYIYAQQINQIRECLDQVISRLPRLRRTPVLVLGIGAFLGEAAARSMGLEIRDTSGEWDRVDLTMAPSVAAAHLLAEHLNAGV